VTPAYAVDFRGLPACPCLAAWLPVYEAELQRRGILTGPLRIYQLIGSYSGSAGTHSTGGAFDILDLPGGEDVWVARQMDADATWERPYNWDGDGGIAHTHGVLSGCPHNEAARYQIYAVERGENGLANHGPDTGPRPLSGRTWRQGIAWAREQEDEMRPEDFDQIREIVAEEVKKALAVEQANGRTLRANVVEIAKKLGVKPKPDEKR